MMHELSPDHWLQKTQPLRIPAGWIVGWNTFYAIEVPPDGFAGSSLLYLLRHDRRFVIDVEWRPEFDPNGHFNFYAQRQSLRTDADFVDDQLAGAQSRSRDDVVAFVHEWLARGSAELPVSPPPNAAPSPRPEHLALLRFSSGWQVLHNAIAETPAPFPPRATLLLFRAVGEQRRFRLDVTWQPDESGESVYVLELTYAPWPRTERGRRRHDLPLDFENNTRSMHRFTTPNYRELIRYLEAWLWRAAGWSVEGN